MRGALLVLLFANASWAQEQIPFPVKRSTILRRGGVTYFVEGRQKIPRGCEISVQKDVYIVGRGPGAVIEVEGSLQIHGVRTREVILKDVWVEPSKLCEDIHLDMTIFRKSGGLRAPPELRSRAKLFLENVVFGQGTHLDVALTAGRIDLMAVGIYEHATVRGLVEEGKRFSPLTIKILGCARATPPNGFQGGLTVEGMRDATVRINYMAGAKSLFKDCLALTFDGNKVLSTELVFRQTRSGRFSKTKLLKCDIYASKVTFDAPAEEKESVRLDKCWFNGVTKEKEIRERVINEVGGIRVRFGKINKRALELAGPLER